MSFNMYVPTRILFGNGQLNNLNIQDLPGKKALIVISDGTATKKNGYLARVEEQLRLANISYDVFDKINANPTKSVVMQGAESRPGKRK